MRFSRRRKGLVDRSAIKACTIDGLVLSLAMRADISPTNLAAHVLAKRGAIIGRAVTEIASSLLMAMRPHT
jgi:hypothetical protein